MRIVVADDHPLYLEATCQLLSRAFGEDGVFSATTFAQTLALLDEKKPDLVLSDFSMPGADSMDSIRQLVAKSGKAPVVVMSGIARQRDVQACIASGVRGFIPKTLEPKQFISAIVMVLDGGTYIPIDTLQEDGDETSCGLTAENFTDKEIELLGYVAKAASNKEIARKMGLQEVTVKFYLTRIYRKMGAKNRSHAAILALQSGLTEDSGKSL